MLGICTTTLREYISTRTSHTTEHRMSSMLQIIREKHRRLAQQRQNSAHYVHTQSFAGSICPPKVLLHDKHSGVDSVLLANMAQLLDAIYLELQETNTQLRKTSRLEIMNSLEGSCRPSDNPIFVALTEQLSATSERVSPPGRASRRERNFRN